MPEEISKYEVHILSMKWKYSSLTPKLFSVSATQEDQFEFLQTVASLWAKMRRDEEVAVIDDENAASCCIPRWSGGWLGCVGMVKHSHLIFIFLPTSHLHLHSKIPSFDSCDAWKSCTFIPRDGLRVKNVDSFSSAWNFTCQIAFLGASHTIVCSL